MEWLKKIDRGQAILEKWIISWSIIGMTLVLLANVISRSLFGNSLTFAEEVGQFFLILVTFVGLSYCARNGRHLKMTALVEMLPFRLRKYLVIFVTFSTSILLFFLTYYGLKYTLFLYDIDRVTPALRLPLYIIILFVPLGLFFGAIQYAYEGFLNIRYKNHMIDGTLEIPSGNKEAD